MTFTPHKSAPSSANLSQIDFTSAFNSVENQHQAQEKPQPNRVIELRLNGLLIPPLKLHQRQRLWHHQERKHSQWATNLQLRRIPQLSRAVGSELQ